VVALILTFTFLFGIIIGSFLNVVIYRYNTGMGIGGRSVCFSCGTTLRWHDLIPVFSFLFQRGRCKYCKAHLSWQYPLVELATGIIFVAIVYRYLNAALTGIILLTLLFELILWSILVVIVAYDFRHKIIPDLLVYLFSIFALILSGLRYTAGATEISTLNSIVAGIMLFFGFFSLWYLSRGKWIGLGDGKLALGIGFALGVGYGISAIVLGFWAGAIVSILIILTQRLNPRGQQLTMKSEIPFAPFLVLGFALVYFFQIDVINIHNLFGF